MHRIVLNAALLVTVASLAACSVSEDDAADSANALQSSEPWSTPMIQRAF